MRGHVDDLDLMLSLDHELPARRQSRIAQHLASCGSCQERCARLRSTIEEAGASYLVECAASSGPSQYGRVRLESALRDAASYDAPSWIHGVTEMFSDGSIWRGLRVGAVVATVCAAAFFAVRTTTTPLAVTPMGVLPESSLTPGAVSQLTADELCNGVRPSRLVTVAARQQVLHAYGMQGVLDSAYELDALITPELGGSTDPANLWPQRYQSPVWNAGVKDELERLLPHMVCNHEMTLAQAQQEIASDWIASYKKHFKTDVPLRAHLLVPDDTDEELVFIDEERSSIQLARAFE